MVIKMNIVEIAKLAGVSKSTVSRYLNDGYVSEDASTKIKEVIEKTVAKYQEALDLLTK